MTTEHIVPAEISAAEDIWAMPEHLPQQLPALVAGGKAILAQPKPWDPSWAAILKYLDTAYGSRAIWVKGESDAWEKRMDLIEPEIVELRQAEADVERTRAEMAAARELYVGCDRERRRRERVLGRAPFDHDKQRVILPSHEKLSPRDFERLEVEFKRREREYIDARETHERALGALTELKAKIQKRRFYTPFGDFD